MASDSEKAAIAAADVWPRGVARFDRVAWPMVALSFGLIQPILDLLGRSPALFGARNSPASDIALIGATIGLAVPLVASSLALLPGRPGRTLFFLATSLGLFALGAQLPAIAGVESSIAWAFGGFAFVMIGMRLFERASGVRAAVRLLTLSPLIFVTTFLFASPTGASMRTGSVPLPDLGAPGNGRPVVVVVFDELPVASLITPEGEIRSDWFPNFARLASESAWFRNAATVQQQTQHAVPALLTGIDPPQSADPILSDHPGNLFTLLRETHDVRAIEALTSLCARPCRPIVEAPAASERLPALARDIWIATGHRLLPPVVRAELPSIEDNWADFGLIRFEDRIKTDRALIIDAFTGAISAGREGALPPAYFMHVLLPHRPWEHVPDGRLIAHRDVDPPGVIQGTWLEEWPSSLALQQHLLELQFTDRLLGEILDSIETHDAFHDAVVVVTADHGISIRPGVRYLRSIEASNMGEIGAIPMFIRAPGLSPGSVSDYRALSLDVLPTIADALDVDIPWPVEGTSLLEPRLPDRYETTTTGPVAQVTWGASGQEKYEMARRIENLFPTGNIYELDAGPLSRVIGSAASDWPACTSCSLDAPGLFQDVDLEHAVIPNVVSGVLPDPLPTESALGVAVNGTVVAVTFPFSDASGRLVFEALFDPRFLHEGRNDIDVVVVS